ncbi:nuclear transport factor 2 family protein [Rhodococcus hoagii]|nr:nuclear transport factor 2 family protein [Prescottella equi]
MEQQTSTDPRGEVQDLLARIAQLADDGTVEEYLEHFTADAIWESQANPGDGMAAQMRKGVEATRKGCGSAARAECRGPARRARHVITPSRCRSNSDVEASSTA